MKTNFLIIILLLATGMVVISCKNNNKYRPDAIIITAFNNQFPQAKQIEWEPKQGYQVAEFHDNGTESKAWFDNKGKWMMTESNLKYSALPQPIRNDFEKSTYYSWKKNDIDKVERLGMSPVYVIGVEKEEQDTDLYYSEDGTLIKTINDVKKGDLVKYMPLNPAIKEQIAQKYPDATVIETDSENGMLEIDILDNGKSKEVVFNGDNWESTSWKVSKSEVPSTVMGTLRKSEYNKYRMDDIYFYETPVNSYYLFELEQGDSKVRLSIDPTGNTLN